MKVTGTVLLSPPVAVSAVKLGEHKGQGGGKRRFLASSVFQVLYFNLQKHKNSVFAKEINFLIFSFPFRN